VRLARSGLFAYAIRPEIKPRPKTLDRLLVALEAPAIDEAARARLARSLDRHGEQHVILLVRTIIESEGGLAQRLRSAPLSGSDDGFGTSIYYA
jgi:hypothetical protein